MNTSFTELRRASLAVAWRHLYKWVSIPANFMPTVLFPMFFFISFAGGLSSIDKIPGFNYEPGYTAFQYVFIVIQASAFGGLATGFSIAGDFESGFIHRLMLSTTSRLAILIGYIISTAVRAIVIIGLVTVVALASGMPVLGSPTDLLKLFSLAALLNIGGTCWGAGVMFRGRSAQFAPAMQVPFFIAIFLAPVYVPLAFLTGWVAAVATYNPITLLLETGRDLFAGQAPPHLLGAYAAALTMFAVLLTWGIRGLHKAERAG